MKNPLLILVTCSILAIPNVLLAEQLSQPLIQGAMKECHDGRVAHDRSSKVGHFEKGQALG
ncbi:MAG: hypothetical protein HOP32_00975, partial [Nitrospira sp.]|nr:hypothetical protein [Nitrospira sp.]